MKPLPFDADRPAFVVEEPAEQYLEVLGAARQVAAHIVKTPGDGLAGAARYMHRASQELVDAVPAERSGPAGGRRGDLRVPASGDCGLAGPRRRQDRG